jgi:hypothetical protein
MTMDLTGIVMPQMTEGTAFRVPEIALDLTRSGDALYYSNRGGAGSGQVVQIYPASRRARRIGQIREQFIRYLAFVDGGLSFVSIRETSNLFVRNAVGQFVAITHGEQVSSAGHCGSDLIVVSRRRSDTVIERMDTRGNVLQVIGTNWSNSTAACSPDGKVWYIDRMGTEGGIQKCSAAGCREFVSGSVASPSVSPDGDRVEFTAFEKRGPIVKWVNADGGQAHEVSETETGCEAGWASARTLWVSRRRAGKVVWAEVDAESGREVGRTAPGSRDCSDGRRDPNSPVQPDLRIVYDQASQLRLLSRQHLPH